LTAEGELRRQASLEKNKLMCSLENLTFTGDVHMHGWGGEAFGESSLLGLFS